VRGVTGLDGDVEDPALAFKKAESRPFEQDPTPQPNRSLACRGGHDPIQL